jgi:general stress protein YciG
MNTDYQEAAVAASDAPEQPKDDTNEDPKSKRGFAAMEAERQRAIASSGGQAAHAKGTAHEFDRDEAREAGRKGGIAVSKNREHMSAIGRAGGLARAKRRKEAARQAEAQAAPQGTTDPARSDESAR